MHTTSAPSAALTDALDAVEGHASQALHAFDAMAHGGPTPLVKAQEMITRHAVLMGAAAVESRKSGYGDLANAYSAMDTFLTRLGRRSMATGSDYVEVHQLSERIDYALHATDLTVLER